MKLNFKRLIAMFLSIMMVVGMLPTMVFAEETEVTTEDTVITDTADTDVVEPVSDEDEATDTTTIEGVIYKVVDGTVQVIDGKSASGDVSIPEKVTIGETEYIVTVVADNAFNDANEVTSVVVPDSVTTLGGAAFANMDKLTSITIGNGVTNWGSKLAVNNAELTTVVIAEGATLIGDTAFRTCPKLADVTLPSTLKTIGATAFAYAAITELEIPASVETIGADAFKDIDTLKKVTFNSVPTSLGTTVFQMCDGLEEVVLPEGLTSIPQGTFRYCTSLKTINFPESLTEIGNYSFQGCTSLETVTISKNITNLVTNAFNGCTGLKDLTIEEGFNGTIGAYVFQGCTALETVVIPSSMETVGESMFNMCSNLKNVTLSEGVKTLNISAFANRTSLESLTLPDSLERMRHGSLANCTGLRELIITGDNLPVIEHSNALDGLSEDLVVFYDGDDEFTGNWAALADNVAKETPEAKNYVAQIDATRYESIQAAVDAAQNGNTITLLADVTEDVTVNKNLTIDGGNFKYTGKMDLKNVSVTIQNVNFVKGQINKDNNGTSEKVTIKNCTFDGQGLNEYAVNLYSTNNIVIEDCTAKNYGYGFLQVPSSNVSVSVKNVEISDVGYGIKIDYSNGVTLENVDITASTAGVLNSNYGEKQITIKNSEINIYGTWTRNNTTKTTVVFEGQNTVGEFVIDEAIDVFKLAAGATLTAPEGLNVTTNVDGYVVKYETSTYSLVKEVVAETYVAQIGETKYTSIQAAVDEAQDGDTIELIADMTLTDDDIVMVDSYKVMANVDGKNITLDMNGKKITVEYAGGPHLVAVIRVADGAGLTVTGNGTIDIIGENSINVAYMFWKAGTTGYLTVENGTYHMADTADSMVYTNGHEIVTIEGGTWTLDTVNTRGDSDEPWIFNVQGAGDHSIVITGGSFNADINRQKWSNEAVVAKDHYVIEENGYWTVYEGAVAYVNEGMVTGPYYVPKDVGYATLAEAVAAAVAKNDSSITLLKNAEVTGNVVINEGITLNCGDYNVVLASATATLTAAEGLNVTTNVAGNEVVYENGVYKVPAKTYVAQIGTTQYESIQAAVNAAQNDATITLIADITLSETVTVPADKKITLDLNGKTISGVDTTALYSLVHVKNGADLTIEDSTNSTGKITYAADTENKTGAAVFVEGNLTLTSGTIELTGEWIIGFAVDVHPNAWGTVYNKPTNFTMDGGKIVASDSGVRVANYSAANSAVSATFTMTGGVIETDSDGIFVQHMVACDLNVAVTNGTITSGTHAIRIFGDTVVNDVCVTISGGSFTGNLTNLDNTGNGKTAISGGTFNSDPTNWVAEGFKAVGDVNGTWTVSEAPKVYVAQIGDTGYTSIQAAVNAAQDGDTIKVISDIALTTADCTTNEYGYSVLVVVAGKSVTIDLNGKAITVNANAADLANAMDTMLLGVFCADTNGKLTLKDSVGTGSVSVTANDATVYSLATCYGEGGKLNIESGSYSLDNGGNGKGMIYSQHDEVVTVTGGNFHLGNVGTLNNGSPWIFNASGQNTQNIIVLGGTYNADIFHQYYIFEVKDTTEVAELLGVPVKAAKNNDDGTWTVVDAVAYVDEQHKSGNWYTQNTGYVTLEDALAVAGKYINGDKGYTVTLVADVEVTGNVVIEEGVTLDCDDYAVVLADKEATLTAAEDLNVTTDVDGYEVVYEDGVYKVVAYVAQIGETKYTSLKTALEACTNGETVKLIADITYTEDDVVPAHGGATGFGKYDQYNPSIIYIGGTKGDTEAENQPSNVNAVLDLNGYTITNNADAYLFLIMDNAKVTFTDSVGSGAVIGTSEDYPVIWACGTDTLVTIESGKYTTANDEGLLWSTHAGDLVITGGEFETTADDASFLIMLNSKPYNNPNYFLVGVATVNISGGTFYGFDPEKVGDDYGATSIEDIKFVDGCADGYEAKENDNGTYGVEKIKVAEVNGTPYTSIQAAVDAAQNGDTVKLIADITLSETVTVPAGKKITLDLNGKTISGVDTKALYSLVHVENGADLTIKDSTNSTGKITYAAGEGDKTGAAVWVEGSLIQNGGTIELTGTWDFGFAVDVRPNAWGTAYTEATSFVMNGGTINATDTAVRVASNSSDSYEELGVSFTMNDGTIDSDWDAIFVQHLYAGDLDVKVVDGTVSGTNSVLRVYGNAGSDVSMTVEGGTFTGEVKVAEAYADADPIAMTGGTFDNDVNEYCADGYKAVDNGDETWTVEKVEEVELFNSFKTVARLGETLSLIFTVPYDAIAISSQNDYSATIVMTLADGTTRTETIDGADWAKNSSSQKWWIEFAGIAAKEMADSVSITIYKSVDGETVKFSETYTDSVMNFADRLLANSKNANEKTMAVDMLNYGAAAQIEFNYNTNSLATQLLTDEEKALATATVPSATNKRTQSESTYARGLRMVLESDLSMVFTFNNISDGMYVVATYTDHYGNAKSVRQNEYITYSDHKGFRVSGLAVADANQMVTCTLYSSTGEVLSVVTDSINSYCARAIAGADDDRLFESLLKFAQSAYNSLHD